MRRHLLMLALTVAAPAALAQQTVCHPDGNQAEMNQCAFDALSKADSELNVTYTKVLASLKGQMVALERIRAAQRLWIQLRDADLAAQFPVAEGQNPRIEYGSIYPLQYASARTELTEQRSAYLHKQFLASPRNDR